MKAQDFFLMALAFLVAGLLMLIFQHSVAIDESSWITLSIVWTVMVFLAIGFLVAGAIKKLGNKSSLASFFLPKN